MKLKVCGLSRLKEVETCVSNYVDFCGFILNYPKSHRFIPFNKAKQLTNVPKKKSSYVGVLVNPNEQELSIFSKLRLDYFQLYGNYSNQDLIRIRKKFKKKIIFSIQVKKREDAEKYKSIKNGADIILWDSSGYADSLSWNFNWIKDVSINRQKMIAGNIKLSELNNLINLTDIVDVSGALETNKVKDIKKIKKFIKVIKKINYEN